MVSRPQGSFNNAKAFALAAVATYAPGATHDGVAFDTLQAVRANAPPPTFPGFTKGPGYEYPMAVVTEDASALVVVSTR